MRVREFGGKDVAEGLHGPAQDGENWQRTLVADVDGHAVGTGTVLLSSVHRDVYYGEITIDPDFRRLGFGRRLFESLVALTPEPFPVITRAMSSQPAREAFARAVGFEALMCCPGFQLNPSSVAAAHWIQRHRPPPGVEVMPASRRPDDELLDAWVDLFVWIHETWLPSCPRPQIRELFADSGLAEVDLDLSQVAVRDGRIVALACVNPDKWDSRSFVVSETVERETEDGIEVVGAVVAAALRSCAEHGMTFVEFDGHVADPHFFPLAETFPITGADRMLVMRHPGWSAHP